MPSMASFGGLANEGDRITHNGKAVRLRAHPSKLLSVLIDCAEKGRCAERSLLALAWDRKVVTDDMLEKSVSRLRKVLEPMNLDIGVVRGVGYFLTPLKPRTRARRVLCIEPDDGRRARLRPIEGAKVRVCKTFRRAKMLLARKTYRLLVVRAHHAKRAIAIAQAFGIAMLVVPHMTDVALLRLLG